MSLPDEHAGNCTRYAKEGSTSAPMRVLVVDDDPVSSHLLTALLTSQGYDVWTSEDGRAALATLATSCVDVVLLDVMMPGLDGIEVCRRVRQELRQVELPIIFTTSLEDRETRVRAREVGADDLLVKPVDALELFLQIERLTKLRECRSKRLRHAACLEQAIQTATESLLRLEARRQISDADAELFNIAATLRASLELLSDQVRHGFGCGPDLGISPTKLTRDKREVATASVDPRAGTGASQGQIQADERLALESEAHATR